MAGYIMWEFVSELFERAFWWQPRISPGIFFVSVYLWIWTMWLLKLFLRVVSVFRDRESSLHSFEQAGTWKHTRRHPLFPSRLFILLYLSSKAVLGIKHWKTIKNNPQPLMLPCNYLYMHASRMCGRMFLAPLLVFLNLKVGRSKEGEGVTTIFWVFWYFSHVIGSWTGLQ